MLFSLALHTDQYPDTRMDVYNSSIGGLGYDVLRIDEFSWFPSRKQLIELRDKIDVVLGNTPIEIRPDPPIDPPIVNLPDCRPEVVVRRSAELEGCPF